MHQNTVDVESTEIEDRWSLSLSRLNNEKWTTTCNVLLFFVGNTEYWILYCCTTVPTVISLYRLYVRGSILYAYTVPGTRVPYGMIVLLLYHPDSHYRSRCCSCSVCSVYHVSYYIWPKSHSIYIYIYHSTSATVCWYDTVCMYEN